MTLFSLVGRHDLGSLRVVWEFKEQIKRHRLFFEDALDVYMQTSIIKTFERAHELGDIDFFTGFEEYTDETKDSLSALCDEITKFQNQYGDVAVNVSETLGSSAAFLGSKLLALGVKFISYNPLEHEINILDKESLVVKEAARDMSIMELFHFRGFYAEANYDKKYLKANKKILQKLFNEPKKYLQYYESIYSKARLSPKDEMFESFRALNAVDNDGKLITSKQRLNGGLFEELIGSLTSDMDFDDVVCGLKVFWGGKEGYNVSNEFDVLAMRKNQIFVIECKMKAKIEVDELSYKYDAIKKYVAPHTRSIIVHLDTKGPMSALFEPAIERLALNGTGLFSVKNVIESEYIDFIQKAFLDAHPTDLSWIDFQSARSKSLLVVKNNDEEPLNPALAQNNKTVKPSQKASQDFLGIMPLASGERLSEIKINPKVNPLAYYHISVTNMFRYLAGWNRNSVSFASYKESIWKVILTNNQNNQDLPAPIKNVIANLKDDENFISLKEFVKTFIYAPIEDKSKKTPWLIQFASNLSEFYERVRVGNI